MNKDTLAHAGHSKGLVVPPRSWSWTDPLGKVNPLLYTYLYGPLVNTCSISVGNIPGNRVVGHSLGICSSLIVLIISSFQSGCMDLYSHQQHVRASGVSCLL